MKVRAYHRVRIRRNLRMEFELFRIEFELLRIDLFLQNHT